MLELMVDRVPPDLLAEAVEAGRRALQEMEDDEVPARLRRVAASTGGSLPPPFARRLLTALDQYEWLRERAAEAWPEADPDADDEGAAASALFLLRPPGWELRLGIVRATASAESMAGRVAVLEQRLAGREAEAEEARRRLEAERERARGAERRAEEEVRTARAGLRSAREEGLEEARDARRRVQDLEEEVQRLAELLRREEERVELLKDELLRARRRPGRVERDQHPETSAWSARDPAELARLLDEVALVAGLSGSAEEPPRRRASEPLRLPVGVAPDDPRAIEWLLSRTAPFALVVDGYNVGFLMDAGSSEPVRMRRRVDRQLARFTRRAEGPVRVVVIYDSGAGERDGGGGLISGVEVRFTSGGRTADEEVVELAGELAGQVVVVSNDRAVREAAEAFGALALWSDALARWAG